MRINLNFSYNGKPVTMENGMQCRAMLLENSLKSRFCSLKSKRAIALLAIPKASSTTVTKLGLRSLAFLADRFVSVIQTLRDPQASIGKKGLKVVLLPLKLALGVVSFGIGLAFAPLTFLAYTIQALAMMNPSVRNMCSAAAKKQRENLLKLHGKGLPL